MKLSTTSQRRILLEELRKLKSHPTADELYTIIRERLPRVSLGTVYRNLEVMSDAGMILKLECGGKQMRFDGNSMAHHHMRCPHCGAVEDVCPEGAEELEALLDKLLERNSFEGYSLEFKGLCANCRKGAVRQEAV